MTRLSVPAQKMTLTLDRYKFYLRAEGTAEKGLLAGTLSCLFCMEPSPPRSFSTLILNF